MLRRFLHLKTPKYPIISTKLQTYYKINSWRREKSFVYCFSGVYVVLRGIERREWTA